MVTKLKKTAEGVYRALSDSGAVLNSSSTTPEAVIQTAADQAGDIHIGPGTWQWDDETAVHLKKSTHITADAKAKFSAVNGYTGDMFVLDTDEDIDNDNIRDFIWRGGDFVEPGSTTSNFNAIHLLSSVAEKGLTGITIEYMRTFYGPGVAVLLETTHVDAWITDCRFSGNFFYGGRVGYEYRKIAGSPYNHINRNHFINNSHQPGAMTLFGYKGIDGESSEFYNCIFWDLQNGAAGCKRSQFLSTAKNMIIVGGFMTGSLITNPPEWERACPEKEVTIIDAPTTTANFKALKTPSLTMVPAQEGIYTWPTSNPGTTRSFTIPHGQGSTPTVYSVDPITRDAGIGPFSVTAVDATNITITYLSVIPPPTTAGNTGHLKWYWRAKV